MPTLYYMPGACSLAPHITLELVGKPYTIKKVQAGSPEILAVNPAGSVPVLQEDDGWILIQNPAILHYLAEKHPEAKLLGDGSLRGNAELNRWLAFINSDVHASYWPIFGAARYTTDQSEDTTNKVKDAGRIRVRGKFTILNDHLAGRDWLVGKTRTIADIYLFPMIRWMELVMPGELANYPHVKALHDRIAADPAVKKAMAAEEA